MGSNTNEAVIIELYNGGRPISFTVQDAVPSPKGSLLIMDADRRVIVAATDNAPFVGIAAEEKVASDGITNVTAYTDGVFDILSDSGVDTRGALMAVSGTANVIQTGDAADLLQGAHVGNYLESGTNAGTEAVRINR